MPKKLGNDITISLEKNKIKKKATMWLWTLEKSLRRWKKFLSIEVNIIEWEKVLDYKLETFLLYKKKYENSLIFRLSSLSPDI